MQWKRLRWLVGVLVILAAAAFVLVRWYQGSSGSGIFIRRWLTNPASEPEWETPALMQCPGAPFIMPSSGFIGLLYADDAGPYTPIRRHTGIDIFGQGNPGTVPIYAAYDGYLTRLDSWRSTVIVRHDDPLEPGRTIWTYYTHMANRSGQESYIAPDFPPGTFEVYVEQGTFLGYQGEFAGNAPPVAMHLHFSIVTSEPDGSFRNEAVLENTLDPSPYLGMPVRVDNLIGRPTSCYES